MAYKVTILENRETLTLDVRGTPVRVRRIEYSVGNYGPFMYEEPVETFSMEKFRDAAKEKAKEILEMEKMEV